MPVPELGSYKPSKDLSEEPPSGKKFGMGFGFKPEVKPKPVALASERTKEDLLTAEVLAVVRSERDAELGQVEAETSENGVL